MKLLYTCLFLLVVNVSSAQNLGYLGRKNFVDVKLVAHVPMMVRIVQEFSSAYPLRYGVVNGGLSVNYTRMLKRNAFALEGGVDFIKASSSSGIPEDYQLRYWNIMPKYVFSGRVQFLPIGITHQIGIGYFAATGSYSETYSDGTIYGKFPRMNGLSLLYELTMRTALSKRIMLAYSLRFTLNALLNKDYLLDFSTPYAQKQLNFVSGSIGLTYAL